VEANPMHETSPTPHVLMLVGDTIDRRRRTGIHRVTIETARGLVGAAEFDLVRWDYLEGRLRYLDAAELDRMFGPGAWPEGINLRPEARRVGRPFREELPDPENAWLLIPEVGWHEENGVETLARAMAHVHAWGGRAAFIFYDLIPITNPAYTGGAALHEAYLRELAKADLIIPISATSGEELKKLWAGRGTESPPPIAPLLLPDGGFGPPAATAKAPDRPVKRQVVLAGTIEPRKRQVEFLQAMERARQRSPEVAGWEAVAVGSVHGAVHEAFDGLVRRNGWLTHLDYAEDAELETLMREAGFTAFVSDDEGYGLPISESLAFGTPCLCANFGSMGEIAAGGGCLTVDVRDPAALEAAIVELCTGPETVRRLRDEILERRLQTWADYGRALVALMAGTPRPPLTVPPPASAPAAAKMGKLDDQAFAALASADVIAFPDEAARAAFIAEAAARRWPALLPSRLPVGQGLAEAAEIAAAKAKRAETDRRERFHQSVCASARDNGVSRPIFMRVLISTYNRRDFCVANAKWILQKVLNATDLPVELVVVDGGSTDGTVDELLKIRDGRLKIVESPVNVGMLAGLREAARAPGAEYVWLVGDDDFIQPKAFVEVLTALQGRRGIPFAFTNFSVYHRQALHPMDMVQNLVVEAHPVAGQVAPSGWLKVRQAAEQTDNLFTAIYAIVWRADLLSAAYERAFDGPPFQDLTQAIPCTEYILGQYGECDAYWHAGTGVIGNAHNSWSRYRPRWHGAVMPMAFALARDAGVDPRRLQTWADMHRNLLREALDIASAGGWASGLGPADEPLAQSIFRAGAPALEALWV
jgi:glycosyltransferase involved in cell wall biosynthesis